MKLRVWHVPQVPGDPFYCAVPSVRDAIIVLNILADYDLFQYRNHIKPDYSNAQGLEVLRDDGEWEEYEDGNGDTITTIMAEEEDRENP
jgi:hypothetical protein